MRLKNLATGRVILAFFVIAMLFNAVVMQAVTKKISTYSGGVAGPIDMKVTGYTPEKVFAMVASYGEEGRIFYIWAELIADTIYPIVYGGFFTLLILSLAARLHPEGALWQKLYLVPMVGVLMDFSENAGIITMLISYPEQSVLLARLTCAFTLLKWSLVGVSFMISITLGVQWYRSRKKRKRVKD